MKSYKRNRTTRAYSLKSADPEASNKQGAAEFYGEPNRNKSGQWLQTN